METYDENVWLLKMNPKLLEVLNRLLSAIEQLPLGTHQEEHVMVPKKSPETLLTVAEAAQRLLLSEHSLRRWINQRRIPYVKLDGALCLILPTWRASSNPPPWSPGNPGKGIKVYLRADHGKSREAMATSWDRSCGTNNLPPSASSPSRPDLYLFAAPSLSMDSDHTVLEGGGGLGI